MIDDIITQGIKTCLLKDMLLVVQKKFLQPKKLRILYHGQEGLRIEKLIKRKQDTSYVKRKGYDNLFNSWIDKKDIA